MNTTETPSRAASPAIPGGLPPAIAYAVLLGALVVVRLHSGSALWLDEALSVNIARLPVHELLAALREDGSPPLYYLLLHGWIVLFGIGAGAVRALSVVFSLLALPVAYLVGRRLDGRYAGAAAMLLLAACPFAIRYATETRMYALVMLLALAIVVAVLRAAERPNPSRLALVALLAGMLALTHYWTLFLLAAGEIGLLVQAYRERWRGPALRILLAAPCGALLFLPWLPSFLFQTHHTGTPWAALPTWRDVAGTLRQWAGPGAAGLALAVLLGALALWAVPRRPARRLLLIGLGALVLGLVASRVQGAGYALRYSAPDLAVALPAAALGARRLGGLRGAAAVAAAAVLGLTVALTSPLLGSRTQAAQTAALLRTRLGPGDLVVYCPDQLGPAVDRLLPAGTAEVVYPTMGSPRRVDWVDYESRNEAGSPATFAAAVDARATGAVWLVRADGYRTFGTQCAELDQLLTSARGGRTVLQQPRGTGETEWLIGYGTGS
jgi:mannosyltransferase